MDSPFVILLAIAAAGLFIWLIHFGIHLDDAKKIECADIDKHVEDRIELNITIVGSPETVNEYEAPAIPNEYANFGTTIEKYKYKTNLQNLFVISRVLLTNGAKKIIGILHNGESSDDYFLEAIECS